MSDSVRRAYLPPGPATLLRDVGPPVVLAGVLVLVGHWHWNQGAVALAWPASALTAGASLALAARRPWPTVAYGLSVILVAAYLMAGYPAGPTLIAPFVGLLHLVAYERPRQALVAAALGGITLAVAHLHAASWLDAAVFLAVWVALAGVFAALQGVRRAFELEARAGRAWAERSRDEEARRRLAEERLRMAREVHDVLGHSLAVITLQAGVAERLVDHRPGEARVALGAIRDVSRQALGELRAEIAALRGEAPDVTGHPAVPGLEDLADLVAAMRSAGRDVSLTLRVDPSAPVSQAIGTAAYRIVQESLTNVVRHAGPGAAAKVDVSTDRGVLRVTVVDTGDGPDAGGPSMGSGLAGMRERAQALGGTLEAGGAPGGGFAVTAILPLPGWKGGPA